VTYSELGAGVLVGEHPAARSVHASMRVFHFSLPLTSRMPLALAVFRTHCVHECDVYVYVCVYVCDVYMCVCVYVFVYVYVYVYVCV